ncbi:hypothetical protein SND48_24230, partial [Escherichia coli]|nr:hypothetical protein [Escherichia coli]
IVRTRRILAMPTHNVKACFLNFPTVCRFYQQFVAFADNLLAKIFAALLILPHYLKCGFTFCN